ncbi:MAG: GNAT family N-acetyltransferase [Candidatus Omnitrophota bacterium]
MNQSAITIRRYQAGEEPSIQKLVAKIMQEEFGDSSSAYPTEDLQRLPASYGALGEAFFVAVDGKRIIGTVGIKKEDDRVALMRRLFVDREYRKRKIGMQLMDRAIHFCQEVGYSELIFKTTSAMHRAIEICQKRGFVQRAKVPLGSLELLKFSFHLNHNSTHSAKAGKQAA